MKEKIINLKNKIVSSLARLRDKIYPIIMKNKKISIIVLIAFIVIIAIIIGICSRKEIGNTNGNLNNLGFTVKKGSWVYYKGYNQGAEDGIYKTKGNKKEKVTEDYSIYLNASGNYIYFIDAEESDIVRMKKNGEDRETIVEDVDIEKITIIDNWIYYFDGSDFCKIKTNGKDQRVLLEKSIENYEIVGNWIYYSYKNDGKYVIAKVKINGADNTKIDTDAGKAFIVKENNIYYINENYDYDNYEYSYELYKMKTNGKKKEKIADISGAVNVDNINFYNNEIYYTKENEERVLSIYKIKLNGKNETKVVDIEGYTTNINIHDDWIYYPDRNNDGDVQIFKIKTNGKEKQAL